MAKALDLGAPSRFALLKIEDDDDEDGFAPVRSQTKKAGNAHGKTKFVPLGVKNNVSMPGQKPKKKSGKKQKPTEFDVGSKEFDDGDSEEQRQLEETLQMSRMTHELEEQRRRELDAEEEEETKVAIEKSAKNLTTHEAGDKRSQSGAKANATASSASPPLRHRDKTESKDEEETGEDENSHVSMFVKATEEEVKKIMASSKQNRANVDNALAAFYKAKFEEVVAVAKGQEQEIEGLNEDVAKVKGRAKRLYEVLGEAELQEKAKLIVNNQNLAKLNEELLQQISDKHTELEQARSKIRELEIELKKAKSGR